jgi:hypothetical protein
MRKFKAWILSLRGEEEYYWGGVGVETGREFPGRSATNYWTAA